MLVLYERQFQPYENCESRRKARGIQSFLSYIVDFILFQHTVYSKVGLDYVVEKAARLVIWRG